MGIFSTNKTVSKSEINCNDTFTVSLSLSASPDFTSAPKEIALVLDRSRSMNGPAFTNLLSGVNSFLDLLDTESDGKQDGIIGNGTTVGLVSFSSTARVDSALTDSTADLKGKIRGLIPDGTTNHEDAFQKALDILKPNTGKEQIIILFTDGISNTGKEGFALAEQAKQQGITVYSIGYGPNLKKEYLDKWSSSPSDAYTLLVPTPDEIAATFLHLGENIAKAGATDIIIKEFLDPCFELVKIDSASKGAVGANGKVGLTWSMDLLGTAGPEAAVCTFTVKHVGPCTGTVPVNDSVTYKDKEGNGVHFPSPTINVVCPPTVITVVEPCPTSKDIVFESCQDSLIYDAGDVEMASLGRIVQVDATVKNVCPGKRLALAVILYEKDSQGAEQVRGMKTMMIPAQTGTACADITVKCIKFVLPEDVDGQGRPGICGTRNLQAKFIANYIDGDFYCCDTL